MAINWSHIFKKYKGSWVALKSDEKTVVASGKTAKEAFVLAKKRGYERPIMAKIPSALINYVG